MALIHSKSDSAMAHNIRQEKRAGKTHAQAVAIATEIQRRAKKKQYLSDGGEVEDIIDEGDVTPEMRIKQREDFLSGEGDDSMFTHNTHSEEHMEDHRETPSILEQIMKLIQSQRFKRL